MILTPNLEQLEILSCGFTKKFLDGYIWNLGTGHLKCLKTIFWPCLSSLFVTLTVKNLGFKMENYCFHQLKCYITAIEENKSYHNISWSKNK